jgi:uncharacterized tellurite resistance protein B-like protein
MELDDVRQEQKNIMVNLQQLTQVVQAIKTMQNEYVKQWQQTRDALNKLAALQELEFIEAMGEWVSKKKWAELKKDPR